MKNKQNIIFILLTILIVNITSCNKKKDDNIVLSNQRTAINDDKYSIYKTIFIEYYDYSDTLDPLQFQTTTSWEGLTGRGGGGHLKKGEKGELAIVSSVFHRDYVATIKPYYQIIGDRNMIEYTNVKCSYRLYYRNTFGPDSLITPKLLVDSKRFISYTGYPQ